VRLFFRGHLLGRATAAEHGDQGLTDRGEPVQVVGMEVLAPCPQRQTDHVDGVLFIDRMGAATRNWL
jgi:peptide deformylase